MKEKENQTSGWSELGGIVLFLLAIISMVVFVDWSLAPSNEHMEAYENCIKAEQSLGDSIYQERPDCRAVLEAAD